MAVATTLRKFLIDHKSTTNYTHLSLSPNGKYRIEDSELPTLYSLLSTTPGSHHILESHNECKSGPLLIDLDFEFPDESRFHTRHYTREMICSFVEAIHEAVQHYFGEQKGVEYVVSEKPLPNVEVGKRVKDGIHIFGRGLIMKYADQHKLRLYLLEKHALQNSFSTENMRNKMEDVYDKSVIETNSWYLLGCSKPDRDPYLPTMKFICADDGLVMRNIASDTYSIADLSIRCSGESVTILDARIHEWTALEYAKKRKVKKNVTEDPAPQPISHVYNQSPLRLKICGDSQSSVNLAL
jgi:hypothetical protein